MIQFKRGRLGEIDTSSRQEWQPTDTIKMFTLARLLGLETSLSSLRIRIRWLAHSKLFTLSPDEQILVSHVPKILDDLASPDQPSARRDSSNAKKGARREALPWASGRTTESGYRIVEPPNTDNILVLPNPPSSQNNRR